VVGCFDLSERCLYPVLRSTITRFERWTSARMRLVRPAPTHSQRRWRYASTDSWAMAAAQAAAQGGEGYGDACSEIDRLWCAVLPSQLNRSLQVLFLGDNQIGAAGAKALADALQVIGGQRTVGA
jgi:hypothetical protein